MTSVGEHGSRVAALGRVIDLEGTAAIYGPLHDTRQPSDVTIVRDVKYGDNNRNVLDVFHSSNATPRPVLIFVHGGGFVAGNKSIPNTPFYENVGIWAARHGLIGVTITYRLAPDHTWPAGAEDIAKAVDWVRRNIGSFGGDAERVVLFGHSAGASHVAAYAVMPPLWEQDDLGVAAVILSSGVYDFGSFPTAENIVSYVGPDASLYVARSSRAGLSQLTVPSMIVHAEFDPPQFVEQAKGLSASMLQAPGGSPRNVRMQGHNHLSLTYSIGTDDTTFSSEILRFIEVCTSQA